MKTDRPAWMPPNYVMSSEVRVKAPPQKRIRTKLTFDLTPSFEIRTQERKGIRWYGVYRKGRFMDKFRKYTDAEILIENLKRQETL